MTAKNRRTLGLGLVMALVAGCGSSETTRWRPFPDRPVAWQEHDNTDVPRPPSAVHFFERRLAFGLRDFVMMEVNRVLSLESTRPAADVNALDEVPCSTWYCPRNHVRPMPPEEIAAGPPESQPPTLPFTIDKAKDLGVSPGFQVHDADGRRYVLKFDPPGQPRLSSGAEVVGALLAHAAGWWVPGAYAVSLSPDDLRLAANATKTVPSGATRPLTDADVKSSFAHIARAPDGRFSGVAVAYLPGKILGGFDMIGRRDSDPNDRIRHEHRRSLRANRLFMAWIGNDDVSAGNTLTTWERRDGRRHLMHYFIDFGASLGSATLNPKGPEQGYEHYFDGRRVFLSLASLGTRQRDWETQRAEWEAFVQAHPSIGWFEGAGWDPSTFRSARKVPAYLRMTDRDAYWGAKVVTSFSDAQIAAALRTARYQPEDQALLASMLAARRDAIGRVYLRRVTAVEQPFVQGEFVCFQDLAIARRYATPDKVRYAWQVEDLRGWILARGEAEPDGALACAPTAGAQPGGYRVVTVTATIDGRRAKAAHIHLRWRPEERRLVVVGLERDE